MSDTVESGGLDADGNGIVDALVDSDGDGIADNVDASVTGGADADADGIDDAFDSDFIATGDIDNDGIVDASDLDANGDGVVDGNNAIANGTLLDDDNDGIPNFQDTDSDGGTTGGSTGPDVPRVETGLSGYAGCSIMSSAGSGFDPLLFLLMLSALGVLVRGRRDQRRRVIRIRSAK